MIPSMNNHIYLDYAAATPVDPEITQYITEHINSLWANPSSPHHHGRRVKAVLENTRQNISNIIGAKPSEIIFTPSASEANNLVFNSFKNGQIITSSIEHSSIIKYPGIVVVEPESNGIVIWEKIAAQITPRTSLISIIWVHNELGVINSIKEISKQIKKLNIDRAANDLPDIVFHTDAVQAPNYLTVNVDELGVDLLTISSQKIYAPRGAAAMYKKENIELKPVIFGGGQESGLWCGTQNVLAISSMGKALELAQNNIIETSKHSLEIRKLLVDSLSKKDIKINTDLGSSVPGIINFSIQGINQEELLTALDLKGISVSSGSSCNSGAVLISPVIEAIKVPKKYTAHLRVSYGKFTTKKEIEFFIDTLFSLLD